MDPSLVAPALDTALRGFVVLTLTLLAGLLLRDHPRAPAARLGAVFALGVSAYAIASSPGLERANDVWLAPIRALSAGNGLVFWLFARALFREDAAFKVWHGALYLALTALSLALCLGLGPGGLAASGLVGLGISGATLVFSALALAETLAEGRADLVEGRRRFRVLLVGATGLVSALIASSEIAARVDPSIHTAGLWTAAGLAVLSAAFVWRLVGSRAGDLFLAPTAPAEMSANPIRPAPAPPEAGTGNAPPTAEEVRAHGALMRLMAEDRAYRQEGLTIAALAARLGLPEYRLRRVINRDLGHRNFNAFLNAHRIAEARAALADPGQDAVPILTIALDCGFQSLGPFNRAFKAATGLTPSDYRRFRGRAPAIARDDAEIGSPI